jgi:hypothetical protein
MKIRPSGLFEWSEFSAQISAVWPPLFQVHRRHCFGSEIISFLEILLTEFCIIVLPEL